MSHSAASPSTPECPMYYSYDATEGISSPTPPHQTSGHTLWISEVQADKTSNKSQNYKSTTNWNTGLHKLIFSRNDCHYCGQSNIYVFEQVYCTDTIPLYKRGIITKYSTKYALGLSWDNGISLIDRDSFRKWDNYGTGRAKLWNTNVRFLINVLAELINTC